LRPYITRTSAAMLRHMCAAAGRLLSAAFLARQGYALRSRTVLSDEVPCRASSIRVDRHE